MEKTFLKTIFQLTSAMKKYMEATSTFKLNKRKPRLKDCGVYCNSRKFGPEIYFFLKNGNKNLKFFNCCFFPAENWPYSASRA